MNSRSIGLFAGAALGLVTSVMAQPVSLSPATMPRIGSVDARYQSYNVETLEVTGGKFWKPYGPELDAILKHPASSSAAASGDTPTGMDSRLYQYLKPIDLGNARLRKLAAALGPAYMRVSGTWRNTTYFPPTAEAPTEPPPGFGNVLSHQRWKDVVDFARAVDAEIVTSFTTGVGVRDAGGVWTPVQARRFLDYTREIGGHIAAAEFMNEPNLAAMGGAPQGYTDADYGRDFKLFRAFAREAAPGMLVLGPGSVGESTGASAVASGYTSSVALLSTRAMLVASLPAKFDAFSYHHYGAVSRRCSAQGNQTTREAALSEEWLGRTDQTLAFYRTLRDEYDPGVPFWNTETADAACGGNPWANDFVDTFRYLDQLGRLARQDVRVVIHNTLVASDYGLLAEKTLEPKPNYWGALLWRRLMGTTVLDSGVPITEGHHIYAQCLRGVPGGVAILAINNSRSRRTMIELPVAAERYTLSASSISATHVRLNGRELKLGRNDALPAMRGRHIGAGKVELAPETITFLALEKAGNANCR